MKDKKNMVMIIFVGVTILLFLCFNTTVFATTGTVTTSDLRLRKENTTSSSIIAVLDENDKVEILEESGDWYKVKSNSDVGYVKKEYIKVSSSNNVLNSNSEQESNNTSDEKEENSNETNTTENIVSETTTSDSEESTTTNSTSSTISGCNAKVSSDEILKVIPLINADNINTAKSGTTYKIIESAGLWSYIKADGVSGWILTSKLSIENQGTAASSVESTTEENAETENKESTEEKSAEETSKTEEEEESNETEYSTSKTMYAKGSSINVRAKAEKSSDVVTTLDTNDSVKVTGESGDWYIVSVSGKKGYVSKSLLVKEKVEVSSRSSNSLDESEVNEAVTTAASTSQGESIVAYAKTFVGYPYVYGNNGPSSFDCSGFVQYVYKHFGYSLSRSSKTQASDGVAVSKSNLQPGDVLIFLNTSCSEIGHVGIYIGNGQFVHASNPKTGVTISSLSTDAYQKRYVGARRIIQ